MVKTLIVEEPTYWNIKDAQTILEKKGIKYTLPEMLDVIIPSIEDMVKKIEKEEAREKNIFTARQMMEATIDGENINKINKEIEKINKNEGNISPHEMRQYLLQEPSDNFKNTKNNGDEIDDEINDEINDEIDLYNEYARQFGGLLIKLMEANPELAESNDWLKISQNKLTLDNNMENWITVFSAKWAENAARYVLNKPHQSCK